MKKILLVNASRYFIAEGKSLLDRKDFQVFMASSVMQALQIHRQERVNLIVTDLHMPEMGGDVLCSRIRQETDVRAVSIILICHDVPEDLEKAAHSGANVCLKKPFTARALLEHVEKLLAVCVRRGYRVLLRAKVKGATDDGVFFCTSQNLSITGILIETDRVLKPGDALSCSFYLPGAAHVVVEGEVARVVRQPDGKNHVGVSFCDLAPEYRREIEKFISENIAAETATETHRASVSTLPDVLSAHR
ncbi:MAG TPA: response regulator [Geobacteraceae bacterium]|nr:response regulator [Geobacteraceae bacterium]